MTVAVSPDTVAILRELMLNRAAAAGDTAPVIRSSRADGDQPPYRLLREAGEIRAKHAPVRNPARVAASFYELTQAAATAAYRRASALLHGFGPALVELGDGSNAIVWRVFDETGVQAPVQDPDTRWWIATGVFDLHMTDRAVG